MTWAGYPDGYRERVRQPLVCAECWGRITPGFEQDRNDEIFCLFCAEKMDAKAAEEAEEDEG